MPPIHSKCPIQWVLVMFVELCNHNQFGNIFYQPAWDPVYLGVTPSLWPPRIFPISVYLPTPDISCTWNHMRCGLLRLVPLDF